MPDVQYPTTFNPAPNALQMIGQYQGISNAMQQNALLQQELPLVQARTGVEQQNLAQQQIQTKQAQDIQGALGDLQNYPDGKGGWDYNAWASNTAKTRPLAMQTVFDIRNKNAGSLVTGATDEGGNQVAMTPEQVSIASHNRGASLENGQQQPNTSTSTGRYSGINTFPAGLPADPLNQRGYMKGKLDANDAAQKDIAPLENVYDIIKKNPENQGTALGQWNTFLAQHNIPIGNSAAEAIQLTKDHAAQLQVNTDSPTDKARFDQELANLNPNDLGGSLKRMIPYLIGSREMAQDQAKYLQQQEPNGTNPKIIGNARAFLQPRSDPRIYEMRWLQQNDPEAFSARAKSLSPTELSQLSKTDKELTTKQPIGGQ